MTIEQKTAQPRSRLGLSALDKLTLAGLLGNAAGYAWLMLALLVAGVFVLPLAILIGVMVLGAGVVAIGRRWTPLAGVVLGSGTLIAVAVQPYFNEHLTHPAEFSLFAPTLFTVVCGVVALGAGLAARLQNYRGAERRAPRWMVPALTGLAGLVVGALIVAALPPANVAPTSTGGEPTVHAGLASFTPNAVRVQRGQKLKLVDDSSILHILDNGKWRNNAPVPEQQPGAPVVHNLMLNGNTVEIGPFTTLGTYDIYCTIHAGMDLVVVVQ